jgi:agmatinase
MTEAMQFLSLPNAPVTEADIIILPVPYEQTVTFMSGTANGPQAILAASEQLEFYEEDMGWCPTEYLRISVLPEFPADRAEAEEAFHRRLHEYTTALPSQALFIALGGEHSITPEMIFARMPEGGTVVQIDAHADLRPEYHGSIYNHACPMHRLRQRGYALIQIGIRSLHAQEATMIAADPGITTYFDRRLHRPEEWAKLRDQLATLHGPVWLTIDMDGFDPALIPGVGTPQPGGLSWHQGLDILEILTHNPALDLRGIDILELKPDPSRVSDMMAAKLVQKCMSYWGMSRGRAQGPVRGSQIGVHDE